VATPDHKPRPSHKSHKKVAKRHRGRALAAKAHHTTHHTVSAETADTGRLEIGEASWYGTRQTIGHRTASGERFDPTRLTAAHPSLPMNTKVRVENLANGRSVTVRINDRLPGTDNRVIDLSSRAAEVLGMKQRGVARVAVVPLAPSP
jgi:rare lipoprotein A